MPQQVPGKSLPKSKRETDEQAVARLLFQHSPSLSEKYEKWGQEHPIQQMGVEMAGQAALDYLGPGLLKKLPGGFKTAAWVWEQVRDQGGMGDWRTGGKYQKIANPKLVLHSITKDRYDPNTYYALGQDTAKGTTPARWTINVRRDAKQFYIGFGGTSGATPTSLRRDRVTGEMRGRPAVPAYGTGQYKHMLRELVQELNKLEPGMETVQFYRATGGGPLNKGYDELVTMPLDLYLPKAQRAKREEPTPEMLARAIELGEEPPRRKSRITRERVGGPPTEGVRRAQEELEAQYPGAGSRPAPRRTYQEEQAALPEGDEEMERFIREGREIDDLERQTPENEDLSWLLGEDAAHRREAEYMPPEAARQEANRRALEANLEQQSRQTGTNAEFAAAAQRVDAENESRRQWGQEPVHIVQDDLGTTAIRRWHYEDYLGRPARWDEGDQQFHDINHDMAQAGLRRNVIEEDRAAGIPDIEQTTFAEEDAARSMAPEEADEAHARIERERNLEDMTFAEQDELAINEISTTMLDDIATGRARDINDAAEVWLRDYRAQNGPGSDDDMIRDLVDRARVSIMPRRAEPWVEDSSREQRRTEALGEPADRLAEITRGLSRGDIDTLNVIARSIRENLESGAYNATDAANMYLRNVPEDGREGLRLLTERAIDLVELEGNMRTSGDRAEDQPGHPSGGWVEESRYRHPTLGEVTNYSRESPTEDIQLPSGRVQSVPVNDPYRRHLRARPGAALTEHDFMGDLGRYPETYEFPVAMGLAVRTGEIPVPQSQADIRAFNEMYLRRYPEIQRTRDTLRQAHAVAERGQPHEQQGNNVMVNGARALYEQAMRDAELTDNMAAMLRENVSRGEAQNFDEAASAYLSHQSPEEFERTAQLMDRAVPIAQEQREAIEQRSLQSRGEPLTAATLPPRPEPVNINPRRQEQSGGNPVVWSREGVARQREELQERLQSRRPGRPAGEESPETRRGMEQLRRTVESRAERGERYPGSGRPVRPLVGAQAPTTGFPLRPPEAAPRMVTAPGETIGGVPQRSEARGLSREDARRFQSVGISRERARELIDEQIARHPRPELPPVGSSRGRRADFWSEDITEAEHINRILAPYEAQQPEGSQRHPASEQELLRRLEESGLSAEDQADMRRRYIEQHSQSSREQDRLRRVTPELQARIDAFAAEVEAYPESYPGGREMLEDIRRGEVDPPNSQDDIDAWLARRR